MIRTEGSIYAYNEAKKAHPEINTDTPEGIQLLKDSQEYKEAMKDYGTGGCYQKAAQAITAALQGLAGNNLEQALTGASSPYVAGIIKQMTEGNEPAHLMAHAVWGAIVANAKNNSATAGAIGAATVEGLAPYIVKYLYPGREIKDLTEEEKQKVVALATIGAGLAGSFGSDGNFASGVAAAETGKNAVENNAISDVVEAMHEGKTPMQVAEERTQQLIDEFIQKNCQGLSEAACNAKREEAGIATLLEFGTFVPGVGFVIDVARADTIPDYLWALAGIVPVEKYVEKGGKLVYKVSDTVASSLVARELLRQDLAVKAGIPRKIDQVWGSTMDDLLQAYKVDGATLIKSPPKSGTSGKAINYKVENHPLVVEVQYHPGGQTHVNGEYYKFVFKDGTEARIIDPATGFSPGTITKNQIYYDPKGNRLKYEQGQWKLWE